MGLFIAKPKQGRLVSSRLVSLYCLNPARPSAPTHHTRQRIKPSLCRLGIQSEQTSDTHQLAAAPASSRHRPRSSSLLQRSAANRIRKKEQRRRRLARVWEAQTYASRRRFRCRLNALAIFRIARAAEVALRKAGAVSDADSMHSRPSPRNGCGQRSATAPWPGKRPAPPVHHAKKSSAALGAHPPHAPTDKAINLPARNPERADVRYPSACRG